MADTHYIRKLLSSPIQTGQGQGSLVQCAMLFFRKRPWSSGFVEEAGDAVDLTAGGDSVLIDCGAGEGRHSVFAARSGIGRVVAVEKDRAQVRIIRRKKKKLSLDNLEVIKSDALIYLEGVADDSTDTILDIGMSHFLKNEDKERFIGLVHRKLKSEGILVVAHFSENDKNAREEYPATLDQLKGWLPQDKWREVKPWYEDSWDRGYGEHFAWKAVLRKL
jgi:cyclopropane fatty-acyl-phospholipid synthase-like methyltransferase